MTIDEFSSEFDTLLNSYSTKESLGVLEFDEYEKSVFLTKGQEEVVKSLYNGVNLQYNSFEKTEEVRSYLRNLIKTYRTSERVYDYVGVSNNSVFFKLPDDLWFITFESVDLSNSDCGSTDDIMVIPVTQDDYHRLKNNPFRKANRRRVLRLDSGKNIIELISKYDIYSYKVRYLAKPKPIILIDLPDNLSIDNISIKTECELNPVIHRAILDKAVQLAIQSKATTGK